MKIIKYLFLVFVGFSILTQTLVAAQSAPNNTSTYEKSLNVFVEITNVSWQFNIRIKQNDTVRTFIENVLEEGGIKISELVGCDKWCLKIGYHNPQLNLGRSLSSKQSLNINKELDHSFVEFCERVGMTISGSFIMADPHRGLPAIFYFTFHGYKES